MNKEEEITYWSSQIDAFESLLEALKKQKEVSRLTVKDIVEGYIPIAIEETKERLKEALDNNNLKS